jgi:transposase
MNEQQAITGLLKQGWSQRRISRELGYHRSTVRSYARELAKCTTPLTGSEEKEGSKCTTLPTGTRSYCETYRQNIESWVDAGLSATRIYRQLKESHGFSGAYDSVRRFVYKLRKSDPKRVWRMECEPAQEAQIDYGTVRALENDKGHLCKVHIFRITLSHSRKSYTEAVRHQTTESFIRSLENAFRHFGGVPRRLCMDNLKAAVQKADWFDPQINPKLRSFAQHYGAVIMPTRPYSPEHKGKIESGIKYVKNDVFKGARFKSLTQINESLEVWEAKVADLRIHGTTKLQVHKHFIENEKSALIPLPAGLFPSFSEGLRSVHRDSYVEVAKSYYHVPEEYARQQVVVRWDEALVHIYDRKMKDLAVHRRLQPGQYSEVLGVGGCRNSVKESVLYYRKRVAQLGEGCAAWADLLIAQCPDTSIRMMQGLLSIKNCTPIQMSEACRKAALHGQYRLADIRNWISNPQEQEVFCFLEEHELIRDLKSYSLMGSTLFD